MRLFLVVALVLFPVVSATANPPATQKIIDGTRVDNSSYPSLARLNLGGFGLCSGTLIASDVVLTAAHCLFNDKGVQVVGDTSVTASFANDTVGSKRVMHHPSYVFREFACVEGEVDVALIFLERSVQNTPPSMIASSAPLIGSTVELVGYGVEGKGTEGMNGNLPPAGLVNVGRTIVERLSDGYLQWKFDRGEANTASGDSGGPAFQSQFGENVVSSITCGGTGNAEIGTFSDNTRIDAVANWITLNAPAVRVAGPIVPSIAKVVEANESFTIALGYSGAHRDVVSLSSLPEGVTFDGAKLKGRISTPGVYRIVLNASNLFGESTGGITLEVTQAGGFRAPASVKLVFDYSKPKRDQATLDLPVALKKGTVISGLSILIDVQGQKRRFILDRSGRATLGDGSTLELRGATKNGKVKSSAMRIKAKLKKLKLSQTLGVSAQTLSFASVIAVNVNVGRQKFHGDIAVSLNADGVVSGKGL